MSDTQPPNIIVFTDLDGTFLDHHTYDYAPALPALERLKALGAHVVPVTSKTMAEIDALNLPFGDTLKVAENGMVMFADGASAALGKDYAQITHFIDTLPETIRSVLNGFADMDVADVISHTGLPEDMAALAKTRLGSEPFLWSGNEGDMTALKTLAAAEGLKITRGGRFYHLMSEGGKDYAITQLLKKFVSALSIALGDGPNDADMLAVTDFGVQIPNENGHSFQVLNPRGKIIQAPYAGPAGWTAAINAILDDLRL